MHRFIVAFLAAVDAAIAVAVGLAATLAPLTLLWVFGLGGGADWGVLWPTGVVIWQFGNLAPLAVTLPAGYLAATGIDPSAASFTLSLAPLAFATFTAIFAARSGVRASRADAWATGVATSTAVFAALTAGAALTSRNDVATPVLWQAIVFPAVVFALPALAAAAVTEWREAGGGVIARMRDRVETSRGWADVPALIARGGAVVVVGLLGVGAAIAAVAVFGRAGQIVALYQAGNVDVIGAIVITLAQLAYVPTLAVWGAAFAAGPGFSVGADTAVSPAGTQVGVVPGIPLLGVVPESTTPWLLLLALGPVALGAFAGWIARSRLTVDAVGARLVIAIGIGVVPAAAAGLLSVAASGSLGPGRLAQMGPEPGSVALAVGAEALLGAAILLLSPRPARQAAATDLSSLAAVHPGGDADALVADEPAARSGSPAGDTPRHPDSMSSHGDAEADASSSEARTEPRDLPRLG